MGVYLLINLFTYVLSNVKSNYVPYALYTARKTFECGMSDTEAAPLLCGGAVVDQMTGGCRRNFMGRLA